MENTSISGNYHVALQIPSTHWETNFKIISVNESKMNNSLKENKAVRLVSSIKKSKQGSTYTQNPE